jgi:hypothetical protein
VDQSNHLANQQQVLGFAMPFLPASASCAKMLGENHFAKPNWHVLTLLPPKVALQCTGGVALRPFCL